MVVFGLLLVLLGLGAGAFAIWVATAGTAQTTVEGASGMAVDIGGSSLVVQTLTLVILGIVGLLLIAFGLWLMVAASKRKMRESKERRELRKTQKRQEKDLAETRRRLGEEPARPTAPAPAPAPAPAATTAPPQARPAGREEVRREDVRREDVRRDGHGRGGLDREGVVEERDGRPVADGTEYEGGSSPAGRDDRIPPVDGPGRR
ncbi:hypothetical protein [Mobilicoccus sp.]|uniref:hypothetical protein n=1 Tax=Mobilicoccus sp. TaxID=2034349 RepID=UPI00289A30CA|nr:hypothetical protein [Mobilicoccus sp.]